MPLLFELPGCQIAEGRVDAFDVVDVVEETGDLPKGVGEVLVLGEIHLLFFDGAHETFGVAVFARLADRRHAEGDVQALQAFDIGGGRP